MTLKTEEGLQRLDLRTLFETSQLLNASLDLDVVLGHMLLVAMSKLLVTRALVLLYDPIQDSYRVASVKGLSTLNPDSILTIDTAQAQQIQQEAGVADVLQRHKIVLQMPISIRDRHIGVVGLGRKANGKPCEADELEFLRSLVNMSSASIHNSLMVEELQIANRDLDGKIQELNTLFDLSQEFNATRDRDRLVKLLSFALMGQLLVQRHVFLLRGQEGGSADGHDFRVVAAQAVPDTSFSDGLCALLCEERELRILDDEVGAEWNELRSRGLHLVLPLRVRGTTQGVLCLGPKMTGQPYGPGDIEFLYSLGNLALTAIQNTYLLEEQIEKERLEEEMRLALKVQQRLLPQAIPDFAGLDIATYASPSRHVAGDYFDMVPITDQRILIAIADVTGHGLPASLLMANIQACLRIVSPIEITLEEATARINRVIYDNTDPERFITFFWGLYTASERTLSYINAGHEPPMHIGASGEIRRLEQGGLLLGVFASAEYRRGVVTLAPGDVVLLFTDGLTEAMDVEDNEYGEARVKEVLARTHRKSAKEVLDALLADVAEFTRGAHQSDDLTVLILKAR